jgi:hypothetical protein
LDTACEKLKKIEGASFASVDFFPDLVCGENLKKSTRAKLRSEGKIICRHNSFLVLSG